MSIIPISIDSGSSSNSGPDYRQWVCRRCHEWCETIGPATYCPKCGKETLDEAPAGPPWSLRKKIIVWSCVAVGLFGLYLLLAWLVGPWGLAGTDRWGTANPNYHWWPFKAGA